MRHSRFIIVLFYITILAAGAWGQSRVSLVVIASEGPAQVILSGRLVGVANPRLATQVAPGNYELLVRKPGLPEFRQWITVGSGGLTINAPLGGAAIQAAPQPIQPIQPAPQPIQPIQPAPQPIQPIQPAPQPIQPIQPVPQPIQPAPQPQTLQQPQTFQPTPQPHQPATPPVPVSSSPASPGMVIVASGRTAQNNGNLSLRYNLEVASHEVTNAQFLAFLNDPRSWVKADGTLDNYSLIDLNNRDAQIKHNGSSFYIVQGTDARGTPVDLSSYPVVFVTWQGAAAYCNWLSRQAGLNQAYDKPLSSSFNDFFRLENAGTIEGYRLPLGEEWAYAARGGSSGMTTTYPGSNNVLDTGWFNENTMNAAGASRLYNPSGNTWYGTMPVGRKMPNELGLFDMAGNVQEWTHDRSMRGASFVFNQGSVNMDMYGSAHPGHSNNHTGFRVVRTAIGTSRLGAIPATPASPPAGQIGSASQSGASSARALVAGASYEYQFVSLSGLTNLRAAVRGPDRFIIAGDGGTPYSSTDGRNWQAGSKLPLYNVVDLAWGNGLYVAVGDGGRLATSSDGVNWTSRTSGSGRHLASALWTGSQYIVTGQGGTLLTSRDGTTWTSIPSGVSSHLMAVTQDREGGTIAIVTIDGAVLYSKNGGQSWQRSSVGLGSGTIHSMVGGPNGFVVAASSADGRVFFSPDAANWREVYRGDGKAGYAGGFWDGANYMFGSLGHVIVSPDGVSWTKVALPEIRPAGKSVTGKGVLVTVIGDGKGVFLSPAAAMASAPLPTAPLPTASSRPVQAATPATPATPGSSRVPDSTGAVPANLVDSLLSFVAYEAPYFSYYVYLRQDGRLQTEKTGNDELPAPELDRWRMRGNNLEFYDEANKLRFTLVLFRGSGWSQVWRVQLTADDPSSWKRRPPELRIVQ